MTLKERKTTSFTLLIYLNQFKIVFISCLCGLVWWLVTGKKCQADRYSKDVWQTTPWSHIFNFSNTIYWKENKCVVVNWCKKPIVIWSWNIKSSLLLQHSRRQLIETEKIWLQVRHLRKVIARQSNPKFFSFVFIFG